MEGWRGGAQPSAVSGQLQSRDGVTQPLRLSSSLGLFKVSQLKKFRLVVEATTINIMDVSSALPLRSLFSRDGFLFRFVVTFNGGSLSRR